MTSRPAPCPQTRVFADPAGAVAGLRELADIGVTDVILRMQWYDLPHDQVLRTMELFRAQVAPAFVEGEHP